MTVNKERVELFVAALESDGYQKCLGNLRQTLFKANGDLVERQTQHCALGVATEVAMLHESELRNWERIDPKFWRRGDLHPAIAEWYGFDDQAVSLTPPENYQYEEANWVGGLNDAGASFWEIAQAVRAQYLKDQG